MNQLAHLLLAWPEPGLMVGGFLGDHVKGRLQGAYPKAIEQGIQLHRNIDAFTDQHEAVKACIKDLPPHLRRYGGILCDVYFDHLLARTWQQWHPETIDLFAHKACKALLVQEQYLGEYLSQRVMSLQSRRILPRYQDAQFTRGVISFLGTRLKRRNPLAESWPALIERDQTLEQHFQTFMPDLIAFTQERVRAFSA